MSDPQRAPRRGLAISRVAVVIVALIAGLTWWHSGDVDAPATTEFSLASPTATLPVAPLPDPSGNGTSPSAATPTDTVPVETVLVDTVPIDTVPVDGLPGDVPSSVATSVSTTSISGTPTPPVPGITPASIDAAGEAPITLDAPAYIVVDDTAGTVLAARNAAERRSVGSLMKMLVASVVVAEGDLDHEVTVPAMHTDPMESQIGLRTGERWSRAVLLRAMLIVSANDAARALAVDLAGSETAFVERMNTTARALGLADTAARNAPGLDAPGQYSTAADMATLARHVMADDTLRAAVARRTATLHGTTFPATNKLLGVLAGADGVKTGHTTEAGYSIAASVTRDGRRIVIVVLGADSVAGRDAVVSALAEWAFQSM